MLLKNTTLISVRVYASDVHVSHFANGFPGSNVPGNGNQIWDCQTAGTLVTWDDFSDHIQRDLKTTNQFEPPQQAASNSNYRLACHSENES